MTLRSDFLRGNARLQAAANNKPAMAAGDPDKAAVALLQQALVRTGFGELAIDGLFGPKTAAAVKKVQARFNMDKDAGVAGRQVLGIVDILLQGGKIGADLAREDAARARQKTSAALAALRQFRLVRGANGRPSPLVVEALLTHFRLAVGFSTTGVARTVTDADLDLLINRFGQLDGLMAAPGDRFSTGVPVNGIFTAAEAPLNGPVRFGPGYTNVDSHFGDRIGRGSRVAVLIHEATHVFDSISGIDGVTHISEFDPAYPTQSADNSLHNPSSFAGFAAHIFHNGDRNPRFGLGPGARGLED